MDREILTNKVIRHRLKKNQYTNIYIYGGTLYIIKMTLMLKGNGYIY